MRKFIKNNLDRIIVFVICLPINWYLISIIKNHKYYIFNFMFIFIITIILDFGFFTLGRDIFEIYLIKKEIKYFLLKNELIKMRHKIITSKNKKLLLFKIKLYSLIGWKPKGDMILMQDKMLMLDDYWQQPLTKTKMSSNS